MEKQELVKFVEWLPSNVEEFKNKNPEEIVVILNKMSQTEDGINTISNFINAFKQTTQTFKWGGRINLHINKFQKGGKPKIVKESSCIQRITQLPYNINQLNFNNVCSNRYTASRSSSNSDIVQFLQIPDILRGTKK